MVRSVSFEDSKEDRHDETKSNNRITDRLKRWLGGADADDTAQRWECNPLCASLEDTLCGPYKPDEDSRDEIIDREEEEENDIVTVKNVVEYETRRVLNICCCSTTEKETHALKQYMEVQQPTSPTTALAFEKKAKIQQRMATTMALIKAATAAQEQIAKDFDHSLKQATLKKNSFLEMEKDAAKDLVNPPRLKHKMREIKQEEATPDAIDTKPSKILNDDTAASASEEPVQCLKRPQNTRRPPALTTAVRIQQAIFGKKASTTPEPSVLPKTPEVIDVSLQRAWTEISEIVTDIKSSLLNDDDAALLDGATRNNTTAIVDPEDVEPENVDPENVEPDTDDPFETPESPTNIYHKDDKSAKSKRSVSTSVKAAAQALLLRSVESTDGSVTSYVSENSNATGVPAFVDIGHAYVRCGRSVTADSFMEEESAMSVSVASVKSTAVEVEASVVAASVAAPFVMSTTASSVSAASIKSAAVASIKSQAVSVKSVVATYSAAVASAVASFSAAVASVAASSVKSDTVAPIKSAASVKADAVASVASPFVKSDAEVSVAASSVKSAAVASDAVASDAVASDAVASVKSDAKASVKSAAEASVKSAAVASVKSAAVASVKSAAVASIKSNTVASVAASTVKSAAMASVAASSIKSAAVATVNSATVASVKSVAVASVKSAAVASASGGPVISASGKSATSASVNSATGSSVVAASIFPVKSVSREVSVTDDASIKSGMTTSVKSSTSVAAVAINSAAASVQSTAASVKTVAAASTHDAAASEQTDASVAKSCASVSPPVSVIGGVSSVDTSTKTLKQSLVASLKATFSRKSGVAVKSAASSQKRSVKSIVPMEAALVTSSEPVRSSTTPVPMISATDTTASRETGNLPVDINVKAAAVASIKSDTVASVAASSFKSAAIASSAASTIKSATVATVKSVPVDAVASVKSAAVASVECAASASGKSATSVSVNSATTLLLAASIFCEVSVTEDGSVKSGMTASVKGSTRSTSVASVKSAAASVKSAAASVKSASVKTVAAASTHDAAASEQTDASVAKSCASVSPPVSVNGGYVAKSTQTFKRSLVASLKAALSRKSGVSVKSAASSQQRSVKSTVLMEAASVTSSASMRSSTTPVPRISATDITA